MLLFLFVFFPASTTLRRTQRIVQSTHAPALSKISLSRMSAQQEEKESTLSVDIRPVYITCLFVVITLCSALLVFLLMERFAVGSFLALVDELITVNALGCVSIFLVMFFSCVSVMAVWMRNLRLLKIGSSLSTLFVLTLCLVLAWSAALGEGSYAADIREGFLRVHNGSACAVVTIGSSSCCGWVNGCNATTCPGVSEETIAHPCSKMYESNVNDFAKRVIPIIVIVLVFHISASSLACFTASRWRLSKAPVTNIGSVDPPR